MNDANVVVHVHSIVTSISGECGIVPVGTKTVIVRLSGCNLRCSYCDTVETQNFEVGFTWTASELSMVVIEALKQSSALHVLFTGGEPLLQPEALLETMEKVAELYSPLVKYTIETNGTIDPASNNLFQRFVDASQGWEFLHFVVDIKLDHYFSEKQKEKGLYYLTLLNWAGYSSSLSLNRTVEPLVRLPLSVVTFKIVCQDKEQVHCGNIIVGKLIDAMYSESNPEFLPAFNVFFSPVFGKDVHDHLVYNKEVVEEILKQVIYGNPIQHLNNKRHRVNFGLNLQMHKLLACP